MSAHYSFHLIGLYRVAKILKDLTPDEVTVLLALEELTQRFEYVPVEEATKKTNLDEDRVLFHLGQLNKVKLIRRSTEHYLGYRVTRAGYDALALHELATKDIIVSLGQPYGIGKEANVYRALNSFGDELAVKFLRWGRTSFRQARRLRTLTDDSSRSWMDYCKQAAEQEYKALRKLKAVGSLVPEPIALNRHVIVMSQMEGNLLLNIAELANPQNILDQILNEVKLAYQNARVIHGDLSEYNVFVNDANQVTIFDWPQWQPTNHPNALWLIKRDVSNILKFFKRRFRITSDVRGILNEIVGKVEWEEKE